MDSEVTSAPGWGLEWSVGALGWWGKGAESHGEEVVRPEWDGRKAPVQLAPAQALPATCSSGLTQTPGKMNPSCPGSDQGGDMEEGQLDGEGVSISSFSKPISPGGPGMRSVYQLTVMLHQRRTEDLRR